MWFSDSHLDPPRPASRPSQTSRNPILLAREEDVPVPPRYSKARVSEIAQETKYLSERPRGLAKGEFSEASQGSYTVGRDQDSTFRPSRKQVETRPQPFEDRSSKKKMLYTPEAHNPILQDDARFDPEPPKPRASQDWRPSPLTEFANQKKHMLPSEIGIAVKNSFYSKRNQSSVFTSEPPPSAPAMGKRTVAGPPEQTPDLLQYRYALPYRDSDISEKPSRVLMRNEDLREAETNKGMAEVYKAKTNLSRVKFF